MAFLSVLLAGLSLLGTVPPADAQLFGPSAPFAGSGPAAPSGVSGASSEFRGLWVDAYRDGFKTPDQVDRLLADARRANVNALLVQVRRRGDAFYARASNPAPKIPAWRPARSARLPHRQGAQQRAAYRGSGLGRRHDHLGFKRPPTRRPQPRL